MRFSEIDTSRLLRSDQELRNLARHLIEDRSAGDDAVQEVWLSVARDRLSRAGSLNGGLSKALRFRIWDQRRSETRRRKREDQVGQLASGETSAGDLRRQNEIRSAVVEGVLALSQPYRRTIILKYFESMSAREIALTMDTSLETVRTRIKRAHALLRDKLRRDLQADGNWAVPLAAFVADSGSATAVSNILKGALVVNSKVKIGLLACSLVALFVFCFTWYAEWDDSEILTGDTQEAPETKGVEVARSSGTKKAQPVADEKDKGLPVVTTEETDEESSAPQKLGKIRIKVVWEKDESPVVDMPIRLQPMEVPDCFQHFKHYRTDALGLVEVDDWPAGSTRVHCAFATFSRVKVPRGKTGEITLKLPEGKELMGLVKNEDGNPVAGAKITVERMGAHFEDTPLCLSDGNGRFLISNFAPENSRCIDVRRKGYAAARVLILEEAKDYGDVLEVTLARPESSIRVTVVDPNGAPLEGALVVAGENKYGLKRNKKGILTSDPFASALRTNPLGEVLVSSLKKSAFPLMIRHKDYVPWRKDITLEEGERRVINVQLTTGSTVRGTVTDTEGKPVKSCPVTLGSLYLAAGYLDRTNAAGEYTLRNVPSGAHVIEAEKSKVGSAKKKIDIGQEEVVTLDFVLEGAPFIKGIVRRENGEALPGVRVEATSHARRFAQRSSLTGPTGEFQIDELKTETMYWLNVVAKNGMLIYELKNQVPALKANLVITVPDENLLKAEVFGVLVDSEGEAVVGAIVRISTSRDGSIANLRGKSDENGRYRLSDVTRGKHKLRISAANFAEKALSFTLSTETEIDLGTTILPTPGKIQFEVSDPLNIKQKWFGARARRIDGTQETWTNLHSGPGLSKPMEPGRYRVWVKSKAVALQTQLVDVESGKTSSVSFELGSGTAWTVNLGKSLRGAELADIVVRNSAGVMILKEQTSPHRLPEGRYIIRLPYSAHELEFHLPSGETFKRTLRSNDDEASVTIP